MVDTFEGSSGLIRYAGIPHKNITSYGSVDEVEADLGLSVDDIRKKIAELVERG